MTQVDRFEELLSYALNKSVTDMHFDIKDNQVTILFRAINGFKQLESTPHDISLIRHLKYLAHLDLTGSLTPQTGSFSYIYQNQEYHFRLAVLKTFNTESCVIRILNSAFALQQVNSPLLNNLIFSKVKDKRNGMILFSGATGSGKTTSLYALLQLFTKLEKRIYTIEDPIEILFENIVQIQVNKQKGLSYQQGIKQLLRHDPDIIVIGEIRDATEAQMAIRSALTGHLVISTVHAKSTSGVIHRLLDLGISKQDLSETITLITNQQLLTRKNKKGRICLYEVMDSAEMEFFLQNNHHSNAFCTLEEVVKCATQAQII